MAKLAVIAVLIALVGCGGVSLDGDTRQAKLQQHSKRFTPLADGPLVVNVSALTEYERSVVQVEVDRINAAASVDAFVTTDTLRTNNIYATVAEDGVGCKIDDSQAGFSEWTLPEGASICIEWDLDDDYRNHFVAAHEMLHTLNIVHSDDPGNVMFHAVSGNAISPDQVAHIRRLAGLEDVEVGE